MEPPAQFTVPTSFEYVAILLWSISGAIVGWRKGYDIVGVFVIAFVSSFGGGLLRDGLFLQRLPAVLTDSNYFIILLLAVAGVMAVGRRMQRDRRLPKAVSVIDALGVPMYVILGVELARARGLELPAIVLIGTISGVGGGLLRDLIVGDTPELLRPGQYNTLLAVVAAAAYMILSYEVGLNRFWTAWFIVAAFFAARLITIRYNWRSRPVNEFEIRHVFEGITDWIPGWKKAEPNGRGQGEEKTRAVSLGEDAGSSTAEGREEGRR